MNTNLLGQEQKKYFSLKVEFNKQLHFDDNTRLGIFLQTTERRDLPQQDRSILHVERTNTFLLHSSQRSLSPMICWNSSWINRKSSNYEIFVTNLHWEWIKLCYPLNVSSDFSLEFDGFLASFGKSVLLFVLTSLGSFSS